MRLKSIGAMLHARNMEFIRDRGTFFWTLIFPFFLIVGFAFAFSSDGGDVFTVGVHGTAPDAFGFLELPGIARRDYEDLEAGTKRLRNQQIDFLIDFPGRTYMTNPNASKGKLAEELFVNHGGAGFASSPIPGKPIRYIDWFVPGVIGMNLMFSSLFGVGFVIVRYRKNGVLKRLKATPLTALEFVSAQMLSRLTIGVVTSAIVYTGTNLFLGFVMRGSYVNLLLVTVLSTTCLIAFGLVFAARFHSEEVASGVINLALWPMLIFSGVFFSLENVPTVLQRVSRVFPLTHFLEATRAIMLDGAGLVDVAPSLVVLAVMTVLFLGISAVLFLWE